MRIPRFSGMTSMRECRKVGKVLQAYLDGQVDDVTVQRVSHHLEACRRCGLEVTVYEELKQALARRAPALDPSAVERVSSFGRALVDTPPDEASGPAS
ncbi:MAG: zf-HC2 domain-containing protein [Acidimicrobiia bacterium]